MDLIDLEKNVSFHRIDEHNLFVVPTLPSWFVLTDEQSIAFHSYLKLRNRTDIIENLCRTGFSTKRASQALSELLIILKDRQVLDNDSVLIAPDADKYPTNIHLALTHRCNLRCLHCYINAGSSHHAELDIKDWIKGFDNLFRIIPKPDITISGGEPTVAVHAVALIRYLRERCRRIVLYTNGISDLGTIVDNVDEVQISLEGLSPQTHDYIRGKGTYNKVLTSIRRFAEKQKLKIALTIMQHNFGEIQNHLLNWLDLVGLDASNIRINAELEYSGRAKDLSNEFHSFLHKDADQIFKFISSVFKRSAFPSLLMTNMRNCGIGISIGIDSNGDIYPCDCFVNKQGNILDQNINGILHSCVEINKYTEISHFPMCADCDLKYICLGGCKAKNLIMNGSYFKPVCTEESKYIKYCRMVYDIGL